jgi:hypothetical protein
MTRDRRACLASEEDAKRYLILYFAAIAFTVAIKGGIAPRDAF